MIGFKSLTGLCWF